ncbi:MAG: hypothetical protein K2N34_09095, partial [Lachnospiraceae bacterium]|nr:hypothetical protein [Lachnospiraceae bacterium]
SSRDYQIETRKIASKLADRLNMLIKMRVHKSFFKDGNRLRKLVKVDQLDVRAEFKFIEHAINECMNVFLDNVIVGLDLEEEIAEFTANSWKSNGKTNE